MIRNILFGVIPLLFFSFAAFAHEAEEIASQASCNPNVTISGDVLVWWVNESGADNWAQNFTTRGDKINADILPISFDADVGFRVGISHKIYHDNWDMLWSYSWFRTVGKDRSSTNGEIASSFLGNFYINNSDGTHLGPAYSSSAIEWTVLMNMFDWAMGRTSSVSKAVSLQPTIGLKGGWIYQSMDSRWGTPNFSSTNPMEIPIPFDTAKEDLKNNFWGIGPRGGLNMNWALPSIGAHTFSLFGDFAGALMYGHWTFRDKYKNDANEEVIVRLSTIKGAATMLQGFMGFSWKACFEDANKFFMLRLGFESQIWLDQLQFYSLNTGRLNNALTFQGGTIDFQFGF